jgi:hypothetical protein
MLRLRCGKRRPEASFGAGLQFLVVCCLLVFLLPARVALQCRLRKSVLDYHCCSLIRHVVLMLSTDWMLVSLERDGRDDARDTRVYV